jgi:hypothetical protein
MREIALSYAVDHSTVSRLKVPSWYDRPGALRIIS